MKQSSHITKRAHVAFATLLAFCIMCSSVLSSCVAAHSPAPSSQNEQNASQGLIIVASLFAPFDFCRVLADEFAQVNLLVPPGVESHSYEPTPADIMLLNEADVFIYGGGESDAWLDGIIASLNNPKLTLIKLVDLVDTLDEAAASDSNLYASPHLNHDEAAHEAELHDEEAHDDEDAHHHHEEGHGADEHVWTSLRNAQAIVHELAAVFALLDPAHADYFAANAASYEAQLIALDEEISTIVASSQRKTLVFGDRFPFIYFAQDYGLTCYAAFSGCSTAVDTNPSVIIQLIDTVRAEDIPVVLYLELSNQRIARTIAEETGCAALCLNSAHSITLEEFEAGISYLSIMQANARTLEEALN